MAILDRFSEIKESTTKKITPVEEIINNLVNSRESLRKEREKLRAEVDSVELRINEIDAALDVIENGLGSIEKQESYGTN